MPAASVVTGGAGWQNRAVFFLPPKKKYNIGTITTAMSSIFNMIFAIIFYFATHLLWRWVVIKNWKARSKHQKEEVI